MAPEIGAAASANDASKRQLAASGTARGGGVAATNQTRDSDMMSKVDNLLFGARPAAAAGEAQVGGDIAKIGTAETSDALQALNISANAGQNITADATNSRALSAELNAQAVASVTNGIQGALSAFAV
jgi:hypothetical protein